MTIIHGLRKIHQFYKLKEKVLIPYQIITGVEPITCVIPIKTRGQPGFAHKNIHQNLTSYF